MMQKEAANLWSSSDILEESRADLKRERIANVSSVKTATTEAGFSGKALSQF